MKIQGNISKMQTSLGQEVQYKLPISDELLEMNQLIGKKIKLNFLNKINCLACGVQTKTSFAQGFCYKCLQTSPLASPCVLKPELCEAHNGVSRDMEWSKNHCLTEHYVYLAVSSNIKVGVTRHTQVPTRWIDQGASSAIIIAETPNRYVAGILEVALKDIFTEKTSWQKMLKNDILQNQDLEAEKQKAWEYVDEELQAYFTDDDSITEINYPVLSYPKKVKSLSFDKISQIEQLLVGIKGQYLLFEDNTVLNIRKHNGYFIEFEY